MRFLELFEHLNLSSFFRGRFAHLLIHVKHLCYVGGVFERWDARVGMSGGRAEAAVKKKENSTAQPCDCLAAGHETGEGVGQYRVC
jgi:hypothetical protein